MTTDQHKQTTVDVIRDEHRNAQWTDRHGDTWRYRWPTDDHASEGWQYLNRADPAERWRFGGMHIPNCGPYTSIGEWEPPHEHTWQFDGIHPWRQCACGEHAPLDIRTRLHVSEPTFTDIVGPGPDGPGWRELAAQQPDPMPAGERVSRMAADAIAKLEQIGVKHEHTWRVLDMSTCESPPVMARVECVDCGYLSTIAEQPGSVDLAAIYAGAPHVNIGSFDQIVKITDAVPAGKWVTTTPADVVDRAAKFTEAFAQPGNAWRAEARALIVELLDEVQRLRTPAGKWVTATPAEHNARTDAERADYRDGLTQRLGDMFDDEHKFDDFATCCDCGGWYYGSPETYGEHLAEAAVALLIREHLA